MKTEYYTYILLIYLFVLKGLILFSASPDNYVPAILKPDLNLIENIYQVENDSISLKISQLNISLQKFLDRGFTDSSRTVVDSILKEMDNNAIADSKALSDSYYLIGVYYSIERKYLQSIRFLNLAISIKEKNKEYDKRFAKALYNLGVAFNRLGDFNKNEDYSLKALELEKKIFGTSSPDLIKTYSSLIIANIELQEYEKAIYYSDIALSVANNNPALVSQETLADLYL